MKHYESIKAGITPQMVKTAAETLHEDEKKVSSAISAILPALLVKFIDKGDTQKINETIREAGQNDLFGKREQLFAGHGTDGGANLGERFENELLGADNKAFPEAVSAESGITASGADRLTNWVAAAIAGYIGNMAVRKNSTMPAIMGELRPERNDIAKDIPVKVARAAGIGSNTCSNAAAKDTKKKNNWLVWLIIAIIVIIIVILSVRSCGRKSAEDNVVVATENIFTAPELSQTSQTSQTSQASQTQAQASPANAGAGMNTNMSDGKTLTFVEHKLPDGKVIRVAEGGCEDCMIKYLQSNAYKNATNQELRDNWIQFDKIDFKHGSETELEGNSMVQLNNIAMILKNYPDVKIKIGGFADKTGTRAINFEISKKRAEYVKSIFVKDGIKADRISTEGFGKEFAKFPANASEAQRAVDRSIALRFMK